MNVIKCTPDEWYKYAEGSYRAVFNETREPWLDRISYALLVVDNDTPMGYATCRETDAFTVYWQFGGVPEHNRGLKAVRGFDALYAYCAERYDHIFTLVRNDNVNYLHLLMKRGFLVSGIRYIKGEIFLELGKETNRAVSE